GDTPLQELKNQSLVAGNFKYLNQSNSKFGTYRITIAAQNA
ncbi:unnamed protein product, partial [marine sediment metagenome]